MDTIDIKTVNTKFLNQEPLSFDEFKILMNTNGVYETLNPISYIIKSKSDGILRLGKVKFTKELNFRGNITNEAPRYRINTGSYWVNDKHYEIEDLVDYSNGLFLTIIYQESVHGNTDDVSIIQHVDSGRYLRCCYNYQSYQGYVYDECHWVEVKPKEITRVEYFV